MKLLPAQALLMLFFVSALVSMGQEVYQPGSRRQGLAGASVALSDSWSVFGNQAGLAGLKKAEFGSSFQSRFLLAGLSERAVFFMLPIHSSVFAVSISQFGEIPFLQTKIGLAYSQRLLPRLNAGMQFNYYSIFFPEENRSAGTYGFDLGF